MILCEEVIRALPNSRKIRTRHNRTYRVLSHVSFSQYTTSHKHLCTHTRTDRRRVWLLVKLNAISRCFLCIGKVFQTNRLLLHIDILIKEY